jgi:polyisoprenyl-phosphate glycosyltransferase
MPAMLPGDTQPDARLREISIVVPVYQGERTLDALVEEVATLAEPQRSPRGRGFRVSELLLVHDGAVDGSAQVMKALAARYAFVRPIWLSRNYGQHAATLAGMASSLGDWVATLDEDGQQDPRDVGRLLDRAIDGSARLVYARASNAAPHGLLRNLASTTARWFFTSILGARIGPFNSFRLIEGEIARGVAAYAGANVYLDVALSWVVSNAAHCEVTLREERGRVSGYTLRKLLRHFWQLVLTSGTRPLRLIALIGATAVAFSILLSAFFIWEWLTNSVPVRGWTSTVLVVCLFAGVTLVSLGVVAEYLGFAVGMAMGKPAYLVISRAREDIDESRS